MRNRFAALFGAGVGALAWLVLAAGAWAQTSAVTVEVEPGDVGLAGLSRPGAWTPLRATLTNHTSDFTEVVLQWTMPDEDGDRVQYHRRVALNPSATARAWTYGALPITATPTRPYPLRVLDGETGALLDRIDVPPGELAELDRPVIGVFGGSSLGIGFVEQPATRHEPIRLLEGLEMHRLPDRWQGLSMFKAVVWASPGGSPTDSRVGDASLRALEAWVERGGHLVLLWPATGQTWTDTPIGELLPFTADDARRVTAEAPAWLGQPLPNRSRTIEYHVFRLDPARGGTVVLSDDDTGRADRGRGVVVARRHGFGRITVIGIDWSRPVLRAQGLPNGRFTPWHDVFGFQSPAYRQSVVEAQVQNQTMANPQMQSPVPLGGVFARKTAMRETAGPALLVAVVVFLLYWLVAGPVLDTVLNKKGYARRRWLGFAAAALAFTAVSWGGAYLARPGETRVSHVSVLDVDADTGLARVTSFVSAYVPRFGRARVALAPGLEPEDNRNLVTTAGVEPPEGGPAGFLDPQAYALDAAAPAAADVPVRSTAKTLRLDFLGPLVAGSDVDESDPLGVDWAVPRGEVALDASRWPTGQLKHGLPAALRDVRVVYCPGGSQPPWVWRVAERWEPGAELNLTAPAEADRLVQAPPGRSFTASRNFTAEGLLGKRLATRVDTSMPFAGGTQGLSDAVIIEQMEILSFFDYLPPPNFRDTRNFSRFGVLRRPVGQSLDLSALAGTRCVILIGHLPDGPLPAPLTLAGRTPPSNGWTTVRCVFDLP